MKIKVCGMKEPENIRRLAQLPVDFMGLIFYPKSPRYAGELPPEALSVLPERIKKVGVFVNEQAETVLACMEKYTLDYVQLHGDESVETCKLIREKYPVIKAFSIYDEADLGKTANYQDACDYVLFDTKTPQYGGSGQKFDWKILDAYTGRLPFFLSGGISPEDAEQLKTIHHPLLYAVDLNSKFETVPGMKDTGMLERFLADCFR
ncbi:MAG: phosphoribosylanthranilate isomerase [Prevotella sp.]|jgi:phosphoribosylanthranilate isomerase|nr:phosphoribosylanthranilate isomerase [Prevotella sp.]